MKTILWIFFGVAIIGGAWYLFQGLQAPAPESSQNQNLAGNIRIGAILPLTGGDAERGQMMQKAGMLALEEIDALSGIDRRAVEIIWEDGKCNAEATAAATEKLIATHKVKYILGGACSEEVLAGAQLAETSGVVWISPSATDSKITAAGDYIFRTAPSDALAGIVAAEYASTSLKTKTAAIISENESSAQELRQVFREAFEKNGGTVVVDEMYEGGNSNFKNQALKIKSSKATIVYLLSKNPASGIAFIKQLKDQKVVAEVLTTETLLSPDIVAQNSKVLEGVIGITPYFDAALPATVEFGENFKQKYNSALTFERDIANYYSAFYLLKEAVENAGDNARMVKDWLYTVTDWEQALGKLSFDSNGDRIAEYQVLEVVSGKIEKGEIIMPLPKATD